MAAKRRKLVGEDFDRGYGTTTIPTDSGGLRAASKVGVHTFFGGQYLNAADMGDGTLGELIEAAHSALTVAGGVIDARSVSSTTIASPIRISKSNVKIMLGNGTLTTSGSGQFILANNVTDFYIDGGGGGTQLAAGGTILNHTADNYLIEVGASDIVSRVQISNLKILTTSTNSAAGAIRVGRTATTFSESLFRHDWIFRNISIHGPGASNAGTVGVSFAQMGRMRLDNVLVEDYETGVIFASCTEGTYTHLTVNNFLDGVKFTRCTSHPGGGASSDMAFGLMIHGPTVGSAGTGRALLFDVPHVEIHGLYAEIATPALTAKCLAQFTSEATRCRIYGGEFDYSSGTTTNFMVFDAGSARHVLFGLWAAGTVPAISMGNPAGTGGSVQNVFIGCDSTVTSALSAVTSTYYTVIGAGQAGTGTRIDSHVGIARDPEYTLDVLGPSRFSGRTFNSVWTTFTDLDTTPSVSAGNYFIADNSGATSITVFDDGIIGQEINVRAATTNTTLVHSASMVLKGAVNVTLAINQIVTLVKENTAGVWLEKSRNF